jgi:AcrR family transcriptional regulator
VPRPVPPSSFAEFQLPRGRHGFLPEQVEANQRWRLLGGCAEVVAAGGYGALTVKAVSEAAAVSKATFYQRFGGLGECVLATYEMASANALVATRKGCEAAADPTLAVPGAVESVLALVTEEPALGHVLTDAALDDVRGLFPARERFARRCATILATAEGEPLDRDRHWRLSLHRVRAAKGWLSLLLRGGAAAALPARAPELAQLLTA